MKVYITTQFAHHNILDQKVKKEPTLAQGSFINAGDFENPKILAEYLYSLLRNETLFESYFAWRPYFDIQSYMSIPDNCELCEMLAEAELVAFWLMVPF